MNESGWVQLKIYLQVLEVEFNEVTKYYSSFHSFHPFKYVKIILSSYAVQKQAASQISPLAIVCQLLNYNIGCNRGTVENEIAEAVRIYVMDEKY